ncbi:hypothetical protein EW146_g89 [Bondarzewia mesenterica]|uniref:RNI-like protein n=1 Tax=Bondarzewia mesenterica TaxID=1095465 RepID=A0A4S4M7Z3_9AGAM|nr:hypothetical protein EW146_g89 [Bondarzewia mesenterica]
MVLDSHDNEHPTESTVLLGDRHSITPPVSDVRPYVLPIVNSIHSRGFQYLEEEEALPSLPTITEETSFKLLVLLQLCLLCKRSKFVGNDVWESWSKEQDAVNNVWRLERRILNTWTEFIEPGRSSKEIEECLWSAFPLEEGNSCLLRGNVEHTWRHGKAAPPEASFLDRNIQRYDAQATPCVLHAVDMLLQLGYLGILIHYILRPPQLPVITLYSSRIGAREILLIIYSAASVCRTWTSYSMPFILVSSAFLFSLPSFPSSGDTSYIVLLVAFILHILLLHLPRPPSPNFFVKSHVSLPLSTLLWYEFTRTVFPVFVFYLPALLLSSYLVSISLIDSIPHFPRVAGLISAPMETREAFLALWTILACFVVISTSLLVLFSASLLSLPQRPSSPWDRYSQPVGLQARRIFVSTVTAYSTPSFFPPPFNLLQFIFIRLPMLVARHDSLPSILALALSTCHLGQTLRRRQGDTMQLWQALAALFPSLTYLSVRFWVTFLPCNMHASIPTSYPSLSPDMAGTWPENEKIHDSDMVTIPLERSAVDLYALPVLPYQSATPAKPPATQSSWKHFFRSGIEPTPSSQLNRSTRRQGSAPGSSQVRPSQGATAYETAVYVNQMDQIGQFFGGRPDNRTTPLSMPNDVCDHHKAAGGTGDKKPEEPKTLARTLFWNGFWLFLLWFWGAALLSFPRTVLEDEESAPIDCPFCRKPTLRQIEEKWAKRCLEAAFAAPADLHSDANMPRKHQREPPAPAVLPTAGECLWCRRSDARDTRKPADSWCERRHAAETASSNADGGGDVEVETLEDGADAKRFREFLNLPSHLDLKANEDTVDIVSFLMFETVRSLTVAFHEVKKSLEESYLCEDHMTSPVLGKRKVGIGLDSSNKRRREESPDNDSRTLLPVCSLFMEPPEARTALRPEHIQDAFDRMQGDWSQHRTASMWNWRGGLIQTSVSLITSYPALSEMKPTAHRMITHCDPLHPNVRQNLEMYIQLKIQWLPFLTRPNNRLLTCLHLNIMSGRASSSRSSKRRRTNVPTIGAPSEADLPSSQVNVPSSSALSVRALPMVISGVPSLTTLCARVFVAHFPALSADRRFWEPRREWQATSEMLNALPDNLIPKIFTMLRNSCPHLLSRELVKDYFLRGDTVRLTSDLGGVRPLDKYIIGPIATMGPSLMNLELTGFDSILDRNFAALLSYLPSLRVLNLRGCTKVGPKTVAAATLCSNLTSVNLNYTSVTPISLVPLLVSCRDRLEVLKLAGVANWAKDGHFSLPALTTLKLRQTSLTDNSFNVFLPICPNLRRLDLSFTGVRHPTQFSVSSLEKLSLTSTVVSTDDLVAIILKLPRLRTLAIGALGGGQGKASAIGNTTAMTMTDDGLQKLADALKNDEYLESVSLVGNSKLGMTARARGDGALSYFVACVGRRLKRLNLAGIASLRSSHLAGLTVDRGEDVPRLEELILNNTGVDDEASGHIASCPSLETLELAGTKFTSAGLFPILDACPMLTKLDLTSCRGVRVVDRRRFFQVWEEERSK